MASSSSSGIVKVVLQSINDEAFKIDEAVAKQSVTIEHLIKDRLTSSGPIIIPNVSGDILAKVVKYYKCVVTEPLSGENDVELKAFVSEMVNDIEGTPFGLLVTGDYLAIKDFRPFLVKEFCVSTSRRNFPQKTRI
ncbi:hypothetical protein M9H77_16164 [Catharanthus roseus]|uniref:Uncharacterized protein n=1 Tax=Catharanthus roseus TaxID=4058 RepID=A0ACC0AZV5_CATRO|nr:hypothetical protein M9H77_16164 [Catharanthus roseus]